MPALIWGLNGVKGLARPHLKAWQLVWLPGMCAQSWPTLCDPMDCSPLDSFVHGDSPGKNSGVGCHALHQGIFPTQGLNPAFPHCRQILYHLKKAHGYWSGQTIPSPRDLPNQGVKRAELQADPLPAELSGLPGRSSQFSSTRSPH